MHVGKSIIYFDVIDLEYPLCPYHRDDVITCEKVEECDGSCAAVTLLELENKVVKEKGYMKHTVISREVKPGQEVDMADDEVVLGMIPFTDLSGFYLITLRPVPPKGPEEPEEG